MKVKLKLGSIIFALYIKDGRFIGYFANAETAMRYVAENYEGCSAHIFQFPFIGISPCIYELRRDGAIMLNHPFNSRSLGFLHAS